LSLQQSEPSKVLALALVKNADEINQVVLLTFVSPNTGDWYQSEEDLAKPE
jgi:hypothetical protein